MMHKKIAQRLMVLALIFSVAVLATDAASHWHARAADEVRCQVCHIGHTAIPEPTAPSIVQVPFSIERLAPVEEVSLDLRIHRTPSIPRAPPA